MNKNSSNLSILFVFAFSLLFILQGNTTANPLIPIKSSQGLEIGRVAPDFTFQDETGKWVSLSDFRGRKVFLFSWSSWCRCRYQLPDIEKFYRKYKSDSFEVIAVASDSQGYKWAHYYLEKAEATFVSLVDPSNELGKTYNFWATENGFLIDESGVIRMSVIGFSMANPGQRDELIRLMENEYKIGSKPDKPPIGEQIKAMEAALQSSPKDFYKMLELAELYRRDGNLAAASAILKKAHHSKPFSAEAQYRMGVIYYIQGNEKAAVRQWKKARHLDPSNYLYMRNIQSYTNPEKFYAELMGKPGGLRCKTCGGDPHNPENH